MLAALLTSDLLSSQLFNFGATVDTTPVALGVAAGAIALCMVVAALVAWGATRVRPLEVLRYE